MPIKSWLCLAERLKQLHGLNSDFWFWQGTENRTFWIYIPDSLFTYPFGRVCLCFHPIHIYKFSLRISGALAFSGQAVQILQKAIWWIRPRGVGQEEVFMKGWDDLAGFHYVGAKLQMGFQLAVLSVTFCTEPRPRHFGCTKKLL